MARGVKKRADFDTEAKWQEYVAKQKKGIMDEVGKGRTYPDKVDYLKHVRGIKPIRGFLTEPEVPVKRLLTNTLLDEGLGYLGGLESGSSMELYGEFGTGKSQICFTLVAEADGLIIFIDTEHTMRRQRLAEIIEARGKSMDDVNSRLLVYTPRDWMEQDYVSMNLPEYNKDGEFIEVGLVVVDSISKLWRQAAEFMGRQNLTNRQQLFRAHVARLKDYVERHGGVLVYTNQIYRKPDASIMFPAPEQVFIAAMGDTIAHLGDYRILLLKKRGAIRVARLVDAVDIPLQEIPFMLGKKGIQDIEDPAEQAKAVERSERYQDKFESGQVDSKPAATKYLEKAEEMGLVPVEETSEETLKEDPTKEGEEIVVI